MTDVSGLLIGIPGLLNDSFDIYDRWDSAKDFKSEFLQALRALHHSGVRRRMWIEYTGFDGQTLQDKHHPRLDDAHVLSGAKNSFQTIQEVLPWLEKKMARLKINTDQTEELRDQIESLFIDLPPKDGQKEKPRGSSVSQARGSMSWAWHGKQFTERAIRLEQAVDRLYELVPEAEQPALQNSRARDAHEATTAMVSLGAEFESTMKTVVRAAQRERLAGWLDVPRIDQQYHRHVASRLSGTCEWIFDTPAYQCWRFGNDPKARSHILWIYGPPGYGKTILCSRIVERLQEEDDSLAYTFCSAFVRAGAAPQIIARVWISQLIDHEDLLFDMAWKQFAQGSPLTSSKEVFDILRLMLVMRSGCTLVVDGLDEFDPSNHPHGGSENLREETLRNLKNAISGSSVRVLIVSRSEVGPDLSSAMDSSADPLFTKFQITQHHVGNDVRKFSAQVVDTRLPSQKEGLRFELAEKMVEKSDGMFLWIKMQERQLQDYKSKSALRNIVNRMPKGLQHVFERSWMVIQNLPDEDEQQRAVAILRWAAIAFYPLYVDEIAEALLVEEDPEMEDFEAPNVGGNYVNQGITRLCGSLIEICPGRHSTVEIVHSSVKEYILSPESHIKLSYPGHLNLSDVPAQHQKLADTCLRFLNSDNVWTYAPQLRFLAYAASCWHRHIMESAVGDFYRLSSFRQFFKLENSCFQIWGKFAENYLLSEKNKESAPSKTAGSSETFLLLTPLYIGAIFDLIPGMQSRKVEHMELLKNANGSYGTALQASYIRGNQASFQCLLAWGANVNATGGIHGTALIAAARYGREKMVSELLRYGADANFKSPGRPLSTALLTAVNYNCLETVKILLRYGADTFITTQDQHRNTSLHLAALNNSPQMTQLLVDNGADLTTADSHGYTAMHYAAKSDALEVCRLFHSVNSNNLHTIQCSNGETPLHKAAWRGSARVLPLLIKIGADPGAISNNGTTPCHAAACRGDPKILELLLDNGAKHSASKEGGWHPIHGAASQGHVDVMRLLLTRGANFEATADGGETPLSQAAFGGHISAVKLLLESGADPSSAGSSGKTPLHYAALGGRDDVVKILLDHGAKTGWQLKAHLLGLRPDVPIFRAEEMDDDAIIKLLLESGHEASSFLFCKETETIQNAAAFTDNVRLIRNAIGKQRATEIIPDAEGRTPLHLAARSGSIEAFDLLLQRGFNPYAKDKRDQTILHYAALSSSVDMVKRILETTDGSKHIASRAKWTPLHWASIKGSPELIELLLGAGVQESLVEVADPPVVYSPRSIAHFYNNVKLLRDEKESTLQLKDTDSASQLTGFHMNYSCDSCLLVGYHLYQYSNMKNRTLNYSTANIRASVPLQHLYRLRLLFHVHGGVEGNPSKP